MTEARKALDFGGLDDFDVKPAATRTAPKLKPVEVTKKAIDNATAFPSRELPDDAQLNIKAPGDVLERFRHMAKAERYKLGEYLEILMNAYEQK